MTQPIPIRGAALPQRDDDNTDRTPALPSLSVGQRVNLPDMPESARKQREAIARAWKAYRGDWTGKLPLRVEAGDPDDNVLVNRCAPIVDKGVSFLFGEMPKVEVKDATGKKAGPKAAQAALDAALGDPDDLATTLTMLAMNGGVAGQTFAKLIPAAGDDEDDGDGAHDGDGEEQYPRIVVQDPQNYWVVTDPDDVNCALQYVCEYDLPATKPNSTTTKRTVVARERRGAPWVTTVYVRERPNAQSNGVVAAINDGGGAWTVEGAPEVWPYPWAPVHDCMNLPNPNEYWGLSDLSADLIHLNGVLNYVESNINKIGRLHGTPWPYVVGVSSRDLELAKAGPGQITAIPSQQAQAGAIQWQGDLANLMAFASDVRADMDEQSRVPAVALGRLAELPKGQISGVALQLMFQPLLEKTTLKRRLYGHLLRALCEHLLEMLDASYAGLTVHLNWPNLLPVDDLAAAQTAQILTQIGVSQSTVLQQLGYDPDAEADKKADEAQAQLDAFTQGKGMPPTSGGPQSPATASPSQPSEQGGAAAQPPSGPPKNHPMAVAQRNATKLVAQAAKAGKKVKVA